MPVLERSRHLAGWSRWRIARWTVAAVLLLTPLAMMQVSDEWHWTAASFVFAGVLIGGPLLLYELVERSGRSWSYRAGVAVALATGFVSIWTTIVRDDGNGMGNFLILMAAAVGGFAAWFRADGLARTMFGVAIMQGLAGVAGAPAPRPAAEPDGPRTALVHGGGLALAWLASAIAFRLAARNGQGTEGALNGR